MGRIVYFSLPAGKRVKAITEVQYPLEHAGFAA
jgi:hypothetical protein